MDVSLCYVYFKLFINGSIKFSNFLIRSLNYLNGQLCKVSKLLRIQDKVVCTILPWEAGPLIFYHNSFVLKVLLGMFCLLYRKQ